MGAGGDTVVSHLPVTADLTIAEPVSETIVIQLDQLTPAHKGVLLPFGPHDYLCIGLGYGGSAYGDERGNSQDPVTLLGTILRLELAAGVP